MTFSFFFRFKNDFLSKKITLKLFTIQNKLINSILNKKNSILNLKA